MAAKSKVLGISTSPKADSDEWEDIEDEDETPDSAPELIREPVGGWFHFRAGCICRLLHNGCNKSYCPPQTPEDLRIPTTVDEFSLRPTLGNGVTFAQLDSAVEAGCWFCSIIRQGVKNAPGFIPLNQRDSGIQSSNEVRVSFPKEKSEMLQVETVFYMKEGPKRCSYDFYTRVSSGIIFSRWFHNFSNIVA